MNHQPFLASLRSPVAPKSLASTLRVIETAPATSPWSPKPSGEPAAQTQPQIDAAAIRAQAITEGRAEGLRQTEALRAQLATAVAALTAATAKAGELAASHIAEAATTIVEAWLGTSPQVLPIVTAWLAKTSEPTTAHVNPADVDALGDVGFTIVPDPKIARGDLRLRSANHELDHVWADRLAELRIAIQAALA